MNRLAVTFSLVLYLLVAVSGAWAQDNRLKIHHQDVLEIVFSSVEGEPDTSFAFGSVILETASGIMIYCDTAIYAVGSDALLKGRVVIDDIDFRLAAEDSVFYDIRTEQATAYGDYVELWSRDDSLLAVGKHAFVDRRRDYFYMLDRPTVYMDYPDTANMTEVIGDIVEYDKAAGVAEAYGNVKINSNDINATSGCAVMRPDENTLDLYDQPKVIRRHSEITGGFIAINMDAGVIKQVDVIDSAYAEFIEPTDSTLMYFDRSILSGKRLILDFEYGELKYATCRGEAYSWYYPWAPQGAETTENEVSGDSIQFLIDNDELAQVDVVGGAVGTYLSSTQTQADSVVTVTTDTVNYRGEHIVYNLPDSLITLRVNAQTESDNIVLGAYLIDLDTREKIIEAYSASASRDSLTYENIFANELQPNDIPVVLKDAEKDLLGDYLRYSIDTKKGRIVTSKSKYEKGLFYGRNLYRQTEKVFYLEQGRYTTCDAAEPHFHFSMKHMKLIEGNRLIAKPVTFYLGRLPIFALPYYVFPLEKGRHSGMLPFQFGNIERGERYVKNVGYYWAASQFWDWQTSIDYYEERDRLNFRNILTYKKLYAFNGKTSFEWGRETTYSSSAATELKSSRWALNADHNHTITPSFKISGNAKLQSDASYYTDYSTDMEERLNRVLRSNVNFSKRFSKSVTVSGNFSHIDQLDGEARTDVLPNLNVTLPPIYPFGSGKMNDEGEIERQWYNDIKLTWRPSLTNQSKRNTLKRFVNQAYDSMIVIDTVVTLDTLTMIEDTAFVPIDTTFALASQDTLSLRSRKEFTRIDHSVGLSFSISLFKYIKVQPSVNYRESWYKIWQTDQSDTAGIDASSTYRTYTASTSLRLSTDLYGTVYPNVFGLVGLRQALTPSVSYTFAPDIITHPEISGYAGGRSGIQRRSQRVSVSLGQLYQAKIRRGKVERPVNLVSINSSFSYDFERDTRRFSDVNTTYNSSLLKKIRLYGSMRHSLYKKDSDELDFWSPRLEEVSMNASLSLAGKNFIFSESGEQKMPQGADSASHLGKRPSRAGGWNLSASYSFSERNRHASDYYKTNQITLSLKFNLTPVTSVSLYQYYNFVEKKTVNQRLVFTRKLHCWTGIFHWVPIGSNKGWGFKLFVTDLPDIKIDQSGNALSSGYFQDQF